jgi:hypothetical protein
VLVDDLFKEMDTSNDGKIDRKEYIFKFLEMQKELETQLTEAQMLLYNHDE